MSKSKFDFGEITLDEKRVQHWLGWHPDPLERLRLQREHWLGWLKLVYPYAFGNLRRLTSTKLGCDQDRLVFYLYNLKFYEKAVGLSATEFRIMMKRLNEAVEDLELLTNSAFGFVLDEEWSELPHTLDELLYRVSSFEEWSGKKKNALFDDAKAAIVGHVLDRTKKSHHREVSALIGAALEKHYTPEALTRWVEAHKMWVNRHQPLLKEMTLHEAKWLELKKSMTG